MITAPLSNLVHTIAIILTIRRFNITPYLYHVDLLVCTESASALHMSRGVSLLMYLPYYHISWDCESARILLAEYSNNILYNRRFCPS